MRKNLPLLVLVVLVFPSILLASAPARHQVAAPAPAPSLPTIEEKSTFNDGWMELEKVIPVPMMGGRGDHLDYFDSTITIDDFEGSQPAWTSADIDSGRFWMLFDTLTLGGTGLSWWCGDTCLAAQGTAGGYNDHWLQYLISDTLDLTSATACTLKFKAHWKMEVPGGEPVGYDMWDGWNVWVSTNGGISWAVLAPLVPPTPPYTGNSSYAFGVEWGMGPGIPAWGGSSYANVFSEFVFPLTVAHGYSDVLVRWAFCSDPAWCTLDDSSFYGLIVDSIRVTDGVAPLLSNDGELDEFVVDAAPTAVANWATDNTTYHSATTCWTASMIYNAARSIVSYPVTLPTGYTRLSIRYWVWCDMPDSDGDNDNSLEDYYYIMVNDDDACPSWTLVAYDYGYANGEAPPGGNSLLAWVKRTRGLIRGSAVSLNITEYAGKTVRIAFRHITDDNDDGGVGTGLHVDDVEVVATRSFEHDLSCSEVIVPFPTTVGLTRDFGIRIVNEGLGNEGSIIRSQYWVFRPNGSQQVIASPVIDSTMLSTGDDTVLTSRNSSPWSPWTPDVTGSYLLRARSNLLTDQDRSNDTAWTPTNVPQNPDSNLAVTVRPTGEYELGYHTRKLTTRFANPRYVRYTPAADGVPGGTPSAFDITKLRAMWGYNAQLPDTGALTWIEFWQAGTDTSPGTLINRMATRIDTSETIGSQAMVHWWNLDLTGKIGLQNLSGDFWISLTARDSIGADLLPTPVGDYVFPTAYDGHHFVVRYDCTGAPLYRSPGRYLLEPTIKPYTGVTPADPDTHTILVFTIPDGPGPEYKGLKLRWTPSVGALGYNIYQSTSIDPAGFQYIGTTTQTEAFMGVYMDSIPRMNYLIKATNHLPSGSSAFLGCGYTTGTDTIKSYPCDTLRFLVNWGSCSCDYIVLEYQGVGRGPLHCGNKSLYIWRDGATETMQAWKVRTDVAAGYYTYNVTCRPSGATKTIVIHVDP